MQKWQDYWATDFRFGSVASFWPLADDFRSSPDIVAVFWGDERNFSEPLMRLRAAT
jgi:hypothetical protein